MSKQATRNRRVNPSPRDMRDMVTARELRHELRTYPVRKV